MTVQTNALDPLTYGPRPSKLPAVLAAPAPCSRELNKVRDFADVHPYGADLSGTQVTALGRLLEKLRAPGAACDSDVVDAFTRQEVAPWLTWTDR